MKEEIQKLIKEMEEIQGCWNGDESGYQEEQAGIATDIIEKAQELLDLINELNGTKQAKEKKYQLLCANCNWIKRSENKEWGQTPKKYI